MSELRRRNERTFVVVVVEFDRRYLGELLRFDSCYLEDIATSDSLASSEKRLATVNLTNLPQKWKKNR